MRCDWKESLLKNRHGTEQVDNGPLMTMAEQRREQTESRGMIANPCGCPEVASTALECCQLRASRGKGCLCACHNDEASAGYREEADRFLRGEKFR